MPIYKLCRCGKKIEYSKKLCTKCTIENDKKQKESYKEYKRNRIDVREQRFYCSSKWLLLRDYIALHQFGLDLIEWSKGRLVIAETYHHIVEVKDNWDMRLDKYNIIGLTQGNHIKIHTLMNKSKAEKERIQNKLNDILARFEEEYYK